MTVRFETRGHIAVVTLDRPEARNAINGAMAMGIEAALDRLEEDRNLRVGVLTHTGGTLSAGADLKSAGTDRLITKRGGFAGLVRRERNKPLIAAVDGNALGGGFEICLACDLVVASETAMFGLPEVKRAVIAGAGGLIRLPRLAGMALAMEMALTGEPISAGRAYQLGLINRISPPGRVMEEALQLAELIAANAPLAVQASRRLMSRAFVDDEETLWRDGMSAVLENARTADAKEGRSAFIEKRPAVWQSE